MDINTDTEALVAGGANGIGFAVGEALDVRITLDWIACDEFLIINDPVIRELAEKRHGEVAAALDRLDQRLGEYAAPEDT